MVVIERLVSVVTIAPGQRGPKGAKGQHLICVKHEKPKKSPLMLFHAIISLNVQVSKSPKSQSP